MPVTNYLWNPLNDNIVREFKDDGTEIADYTTEPNQFGNLVSQRRDGEDSSYHYDGQGSTLALTDVNGNVTDRYSYSGFGEVVSQVGPTENAFKFIGRKGYYLDNETGDFSVRLRPLSTIGRWYSRDPSEVRSTQGVYKYVLNRPSRFSDASGTEAAELTCCECEMLKSNAKGKTGGWSITVPRSDGLKPDRTCPLAISCEPKNDCDGVPGTTHIQKQVSGNWLVKICVSCRYRPTELVFIHEWKHAEQFCADPERFEDANRKTFTCTDCEAFEQAAHQVNCDKAFQDKDARDICVKCGTAISCSVTCTGKKEGPWFVKLEGGEMHRCDLEKDLGGVWLPVPTK